MNEADLIRKLKLIEALHIGATTEGEKDAAADALRRFKDRIQNVQTNAQDHAKEYSFPMPDQWQRQLFVALLRRYNIQPYRYPRQRYTTVMARVSKCFVEETLWPQYVQMSKELSCYLSEATDRIITEAVHQDHSDAEVVPEPRQLSF